MTNLEKKEAKKKASKNNSSKPMKYTSSVSLEAEYWYNFFNL